MVNSFVLNTGTSRPIRIIFDEVVVSLIKGSDHEVLKNALVADDTGPFLKDLSHGFKEALLAICGEGSANQLGVELRSFPKHRSLKLNHFEEGPIYFYLWDITQCPLD